SDVRTGPLRAIRQVKGSGSVIVHRLARLPRASFRPRLATRPLRFSNRSPPSGSVRASSGLLTPLRRLSRLPVRRASVLPTASFRFHLTVDTLAVQLALPLAGCVEDFHLQVSAPCPGAPPREKAGKRRPV